MSFLHVLTTDRIIVTSSDVKREVERKKMFWRQPYWWWDAREGKMPREHLKSELTKLVNLYDTDTILNELGKVLTLRADWTPDGGDRDHILRVILALEDLTKRSS
jgi:hypothetical protein